MSEYQYVHFLAVDRPLDDKQLEYMAKQSSRAEITKWEFTNEYHFGDFRGNAKEMLRHGFDVHLHFANFGIRKLMFRLPQGLPCDKKMFAAFRPQFGVTWHADKSGPGGILEIQPEADAGTYDYLTDVDTMLTEIAPVRELLMSGDLRPLYLAWLVCAGDEAASEPPVPAGLESLPKSLLALANFYELSEALLAAAAERSPSAPATQDESLLVQAWLKNQNVNELRELVMRLVSKQAADVRAEVLAQVRESTERSAWPLAESSRTFDELRARADELSSVRQQRQQQAAATARKKYLASLVNNPHKAIAEAEKLVATRSSANYLKAAQQLADLREALGPGIGPAQAQHAAESLRENNPKRSGLVAALKQHDLLPKIKK